MDEARANGRDAEGGGPEDLDRRQRELLAETILARLDDIERRWVGKVRDEVAARRDDIGPTDLKNAIREYLSSLAGALKGQRSIAEGGKAAWADIAREHALTRVRLGFDVDQLVREFILLRRVLFEIAREAELISNDFQSERLTDLIEAAIATSVRSYVESRDLAERRMQAEHIGFLTHELRNPLATATLAASRLRQRPDIMQSEQNTLDLLERGLNRMRSLIDSILLTQRMDAQELQCDAADLTFDGIVAETTRAAELEAKNKGIGFKVSYKPGLRVRVDFGLTVSALQNVVDNAVKFTDSGTVEMVVEPRTSDVVVHVYDHCGGLSAEEIGTIFEPFKRAQSGKAGTGLGLAIARRAIEAQGGRIGAESNGESGCHFWLTLPKPMH